MEYADILKSNVFNSQVLVRKTREFADLLLQDTKIKKVSSKSFRKSFGEIKRIQPEIYAKSSWSSELVIGDYSLSQIDCSLNVAHSLEENISSYGTLIF